MRSATATLRTWMSVRKPSLALGLDFGQVVVVLLHEHRAALVFGEQAGTFDVLFRNVSQTSLIESMYKPTSVRKEKRALDISVSPADAVIRSRTILVLGIDVRSKHPDCFL